MSRLIGLVCVGLMLVSVGVAAVDPFMGDWEGSYETEYGERGDFVYQIIALGGGNYRMQMLYQFDVRDEPMYVLNAKLTGDKVVFESTNGEVSGSGIVKDGVCTGKFQADEAGEFKMKRVVRLSSTLGAKPPKGAIVLFDGKNLDQWERMGGGAGIFDLAKLVGGDNTAAYIGTFFNSEAEQEAVLEVGSDDGVKVWLNQEVVHTNNASRGVKPGEDKIKVTLKEGNNSIMLKVVNGAGGFGACVRLADEKGKALSSIAEYKENEYGDWDTTKDYLKANNGFLTVMYVCGPYRKEGKAGGELMDIQFEPEITPMDAPWEKIEVQQDPKKPRWIVKDGVMEVRDGSIRTKRNDFKDFKLHVEFKTPFMPAARGQGRGNSGVYLQNRYEVQVLDSYGLEGVDNECGGVYKIGRPRVNMCAPPEQWQTYDIEFAGSKMENGQKKPAVLTVVHNGVTIHDEIKISGPTGGALDGNVLQPGGIYLQDHGNAVQYRNIWLVPK